MYAGRRTRMRTSKCWLPMVPTGNSEQAAVPEGKKVPAGQGTHAPPAQKGKVCGEKVARPTRVRRWPRRPRPRRPAGP
jgi:hypothetical protein